MLILYKFFRLLQTILWDKEPMKEELSEEDLSQIFSLAIRQQLQALISSALIRQGTHPKRTKFKSYYFISKTTESNNHLNQVVVKIADVLKRNNIDYVMVKGQTIAPFYQNPSLRTVGDIDVYIAPKDRQRLADVLKRELDVDMPPFDEGRHSGFTYDEVDVEMHRQLIVCYAFWHRRRWNEILEREFQKKSSVVIDGAEVATFNPTMNILYTFMHFYYHLMTLGCGLRQVIDLAVLLSAFRDDCDYALLKTYLKSLGLYDAFCTIGDLMIKRLGMPRGYFPFEITSFHMRYEQQLLKEIVSGGNFGHYIKRKHGQSGLLHTFETIQIMFRHIVMLFRLSPVETFFVIPHTTRLRLMNMFLKTNY